MKTINDFENDLKNNEHFCIACNESCKNRSVLGWHLKSHNTNTKDYIHKHFYQNETPDCKCGCGTKVSWDKGRYKYRDFTTGHNRKGVRTAVKDTTVRRSYVHRTGDFKCKICEFSTTKMKSLTSHIQRNHDLSAPEYTIKFRYNGTQPTCNHQACDNTTRYVQMTFKKYCSEHAKYASSVAGKKGGKAPAWNKGQTKETDKRLFEQSLKASGSGNHFYGKSHSQETIDLIVLKKRLSFDEVINRIQEKHEDLKVISSKKDYSSQNDPLEINCQKCNNTFRSSLSNLMRAGRCFTCNPFGSSQELELAEFVKSLGLEYELHNRKAIKPLELDLYVPEKNVAIEYHGLFWHSGGFNDEYNKNKHRDKFLACEKEGIKLIQIFGDEWENKKDLCKSMIEARLGKSSIKLNARDCVFEKLSPTDARLFLSEAHIDGAAQSKAYFGLKKDNKIVSVLSIRTPMAKSYGKVQEISRMATSKNTVVRGGAAKMMKYVSLWCRENGYDGILTYADLRFGSGNVYEQCGFSRKPDARTINYWYTDGIRRYHRFEFRAQNGMKEKEYAASKNVRPIHGAGNRIFTKYF